MADQPSLAFWQLCVSAGIGSAITIFYMGLMEWIRYRRRADERIQDLILDQKYKVCQEIVAAVYRFTSNLAPMTHGFNAFKTYDQSESDYRKALFEETQERVNALERLFVDNSLIIGEDLLRVWIRYSGELQHFGFIGASHRESKGTMEELIRFCDEFGTATTKAVERSLAKPKISIVTTTEWRNIRNNAADELENRIKARDEGRSNTK